MDFEHDELFLTRRTLQLACDTCHMAPRTVFETYSDAFRVAFDRAREFCDK